MGRYLLNMLAVAAGAAVGANLRYLLAAWVAERFPGAFPYGTLAINVLGCLAIGALLGLGTARGAMSEPLRLLLVTGLLGGFTTFSTFGYETYLLIGAGSWRAAAIYVLASSVLGVGAVFLGAGAARLVSGA